jgi:F-type H+-transporting ATPase subunit delta
MNEIRIAKRYARAALDTAVKNSLVDVFHKDFLFVHDTVKDSRELELLFKNPVTHKEKKLSIVKTLFGSRISSESINFINFLIAKGRDCILLEVLESFIEIRNEYLGLLEVKVFGFSPLSEEQHTKIKTDLERITAKKVNLSFVLDKSIMGGLIIQVADTMLDSSVKRRLEMLKEHLLKAN